MTPKQVVPLYHSYLMPWDQMCLLSLVSTRTSGVPIIFSANLRISLMARGALRLKPLFGERESRPSLTLQGARDGGVPPGGYVPLMAGAHTHGVCVHVHPPGGLDCWRGTPLTPDGVVGGWSTARVPDHMVHRPTLDVLNTSCVPVQDTTLS